MRRASERAALPRTGARALAGLLLAGLLLATVFAGDSLWVGAAAIALAGALAALGLLGFIPLPRGGLSLVGALLALAAWSGISVAWSIGADRSWVELNRGLSYAAFALLGLLLAPLLESRACRAVAGGLTFVLGTAILWALAGKIVPALFEDGGRAARLRDPIGYWNALALAADALLVLSLWLATTRAFARPLRLGGAVLAYAAVVAVLLAVSRAGLLAAATGAVLWLLLSDRKLERALVVVAVAVPAFAVAVWAFTREGLVEDEQAYAERVADGRWFALVLLAGAACAAIATRRLERYRPNDVARRRLGIALAGATATIALVGAGAVAASGNPLESSDAVGQDPGRLGDVGLNNRGELWREAWRIFEAEPLLGSGAGTFEIARKRYRSDALDAAEPHDVPLQFLADTGLVGFALFAAVVGAGAAATIGALRRLGGAERTAAAALAVVPSVYLLHALVDYDWDFPAVTGPTLVAVGTLAAAGRGGAPRTRQPFAAVAVAALSVAALASLATPWLADRSLRQVNRELDAGDLGDAAAAAGRARSLNPLSVDALHGEAAVAERRGDVAAARAAYARAVSLQPENPDTWYTLGLYEHDTGALCQAYVHLNEAYTLDPKSLRWYRGGPLDRAREHVNAGNC
jgi:tetratricopeptide (TPR) repeat protein